MGTWLPSICSLHRFLGTVTQQAHLRHGASHSLAELWDGHILHYNLRRILVTSLRWKWSVLFDAFPLSSVVIHLEVCLGKHTDKRSLWL